MLRQAVRIRQRSILQQGTRSTQNVSPSCVSQTRTFQIMTRSLYGDSNASFTSHSSPPLDDKLKYFNKELTAMKSDMKSDMARLQSDMARLQSEMTHLNNNLTMQMKSFTETVSAQISVLTASVESRLDKFENRFLFRMLFAAFGVVIIGVGGTVTAALLLYQTPAVQTPVTQTPTAQVPTVRQV